MDRKPTRFTDVYIEKNITTENSDELVTCSNCGQTADKHDAKYCFKCGFKLVGNSN